jgi:tol-pal system protein YbgF
MTRRHPLITLLLITGMVALVVPQAQAASVDRLKDRLGVLEKQVIELQTFIRERGATSAQGDARLEKLESDINHVMGVTDSVDSQLAIIKDQMSKFIGEFQARMQSVEQRVDNMRASGATLEDTQTADAVSNAASSTAVNHYQDALTAVRGRKYRKAIDLFRRSLRAAPRHNYADRAQFWIGECYYANGDYQRAITEYDALLARYPASKKVPSAMLKRADALAELGMIQEAEGAFAKVLAEQPTSREAIRAKTHLRALQNRFTTTAERLGGDNK